MDCFSMSSAVFAVSRHFGSPFRVFSPSSVAVLRRVDVFRGYPDRLAVSAVGPVAVPFRLAKAT